jgi:hypothetical protein
VQSEPPPAFPPAALELDQGHGLVVARHVGDLALDHKGGLRPGSNQLGGDAAEIEAA